PVAHHRYGAGPTELEREIRNAVARVGSVPQGPGAISENADAVGAGPGPVAAHGSGAIRAKGKSPGISIPSTRGKTRDPGAAAKDANPDRARRHRGGASPIFEVFQSWHKAGPLPLAP